MALHRLTKITVGVPNVDETAKYYTEFGLTPTGSGFATADGGEQLELRPSAQRRLLTLGVGADDPDAPAIDREQAVRPRKLGHVVFGSTDQAATQKFFTEGLGFKVSDEAPGFASFMRCSTDHHNVLVQQAPVSFLHHTSWEVDDVDEVGRGATAMLEGHPERHTWGLGRHYIGSNFFWYLRDPAGNFSEYYSDIDCILEDQIWEPRVVAGEKSLYAWGPPPPPSFLAPEDLADLMTDAHPGS